MSDRALPASGQQVAQVVGMASALLKVKLNPVVESHNLALVHLANKDCSSTICIRIKEAHQVAIQSSLSLSQRALCAARTLTSSLLSP